MPETEKRGITVKVDTGRNVGGKRTCGDRGAGDVDVGVEKAAVI